MIVLEILFTIFVLFCVLSALLGVLAFVRIRKTIINPFLEEARSVFTSPPSPTHTPKDGNVIEGEYEVIDESRKER